MLKTEPVNASAVVLWNLMIVALFLCMSSLITRGHSCSRLLYHTTNWRSNLKTKQDFTVSCASLSVFVLHTVSDRPNYQNKMTAGVNHEKVRLHRMISFTCSNKCSKFCVVPPRNNIRFLDVNYMTEESFKQPSFSLSVSEKFPEQYPMATLSF